MDFSNLNSVKEERMENITPSGTLPNYPGSLSGLRSLVNWKGFILEIDIHGKENSILHEGNKCKILCLILNITPFSFGKMLSLTSCLCSNNPIGYILSYCWVNYGLL